MPQSLTEPPGHGQPGHLQGSTANSPWSAFTDRRRPSGIRPQNNTPNARYVGKQLVLDKVLDVFDELEGAARRQSPTRSRKRPDPARRTWAQRDS
ncbi:hypothetical protein K474DRAFT_1704811 [Panus rudis PR-1116 ss-1]|nr:hypothetical protein K474DRAFT_1704811 [Panus rudis PR-1116 ss-1]